MKSLLEGLRDEARAEHDALDDDPRWKMLAEGTLDEAGRAALEALAKTSEEARLKWELLAPISADVQRTMTARALGAMTASGSTTERATPAEPTPATVVPLPRRRMTAIVAGGIGLAAAVFAAVIFAPREHGALPGYQLELRAARTVRSAHEDSGEAIVLQRGTEMEIIVRPSDRVEGAVEHVAYFEREGTWTRWAARFETAPSGSARVRVAVDTLPVGVGAWRLVVVSGRPGQVELDPQRVAAVLEHPSPEVAVSTIAVEIR